MGVVHPPGIDLDHTEQTEQRSAALVESGVIVQRQAVAAFAQGTAAFQGGGVGDAVKDQFKDDRVRRQRLNGVIVDEGQVGLDEGAVFTECLA